MKFFIDTEFMEDGSTIDLLSIALVSEDGKSFYAVNEEADHSKANDWVKWNVLPNLLTGSPFLAKRSEIRERILWFIAPSKPEFWGYYADYDWVVFCQLFGKMIDLPKGYPMYCMDLKQWCDMLGNPKLPEQGKGEHHALADARWNHIAWDYLHSLDYKALNFNRRWDDK